MNTSKTVDAVIADAERLALVWSENSKFSMGDFTLEMLNAEIDALRALKHSRDEARVSLSKLIDDTNDKMKVVDGYATRGWSGMKAIFGPNYTLRWAGHVKANASLGHQRSPRLNSFWQIDLGKPSLGNKPADEFPNIAVLLLSA